MPGPTRREDVSLNELMRRGWTRGMVARLLGEPDTLAVNPCYRSKSAMRLYGWPRAHAVERSPAFADAQAKSFRSTRPRAGQGDGAAAPFP